VTLPTCFFSSRPEIPPTDRGRLGAEFKAPVPVTRSERRQSEDEILKEAEAAARDLKGFAPMPKWLMIGRGMVVLRKRALEESGARRPMGVGYSVKFGALIRQHGFGWIARTTRCAVINIVENLPEVERRLSRLPDDRRLTLNNPQCIWNFVLSERRKEAGKAVRHRWRERQLLPEADFNNLVEAIAETMVSGDAVSVAISVCHVLNFAVPKQVLQRATRKSRPVNSPLQLPWSPFALSL
jgi:hypothetical protein